MQVALGYRTPQHLEQARLYFDDRLLAVKMDVSEPGDFQTAAELIEQRFGPLNLFVSNAGVGFPGSVLKATNQEWDYALSVNLKGAVYGIQTFVPTMVAHGGPAHVVAVASMSGLFAAGQAGVYTTTKFALVGLMEALANELSGQGVGVSICCPGIVQSRIADWRRASPFPTEPADHRPARAGMDPLEYGRIVLQGVKEKSLYILSHQEYAEGLEQRSEALRRSFSEVEQPVPRERLEAARRVVASPIYRPQPGDADAE